jgi:uncharacterized protein involved in exopolysaccharide biosynthesis
MFDGALAAWRRRRGLAIVVAGVMLAAVATLSLSLPDLYRATATLLVEHHGAPDANARGAGGPSALETRLHSITEDVLSRPRLEALMERFDLYPELRAEGDREATVRRLWSDIRIKPKAIEPGPGRPTTIALSVSFRGRDPETVARVANALASFYIDESIKLREVGQLTRLKQELTQMQQHYSNQYPDVIRLKSEIAAGERRLSTAIRDGGERSETAAVIRQAEFRVLEPAIPGGSAAAPNRLALALGGLLLTVATVAGTVVMTERLDSSFHTPDDVRSFTKLPVLAGIPRIVTRSDRRPRRWRVAASIALGLALVVLVSYYLARGNEWLVWTLTRGAS